MRISWSSLLRRKLDSGSDKLYFLLEEVDADGLLVLVCEDALAVSLDHGRLADGAVAHNQHLDCQLNVLLHLRN